MKILIYSRMFFPHVGGVESLVRALAEGLASVPSPTGQFPVEVTVVTCVTFAGDDTGTFPFRVVRGPGFWRLLREMRRTDVIHLAGPTLLPMLLGSLVGKAVVVEHHGFQTVCPNGQLLYEPEETPCPGHFQAGRHLECWRCNAGQGWLTSVKMWLLTFVRRWLCGRVQANIVPTAWLGGILCLSRTTAIPHGLAAVDCTEQAMPSGSAPKFVFVGRLVTTKGVRTLLESAQRLREDGLKFCVEIIGEGPESARLKGLASDLGLQGCVEFRGGLPAHELDAALRSASAVVMPSLGGEVFGLVAAEAMARGRAVIASDLGALREVVGDAGWLFPPGDAQALAQALREVIGDPHAALRRGAIGQERVRRLFSLQAMIDKHLDVYRHWIH